MRAVDLGVAGPRDARMVRSVPRSASRCSSVHVVAWQGRRESRGLSSGRFARI